MRTIKKGLEYNTKNLRAKNMIPDLQSNQDQKAIRCSEAKPQEYNPSAKKSTIS